MVLCDAAGVPPGRWVHVRRGGAMRTYLTFGDEGRSTHWLDLDREHRFQVFGADQMRGVEVFAIDLTERVRLSVKEGPPDPNRMGDLYGCVGVSAIGPVLCGRTRQANFGGDAPEYFSLETWQLRIPDHRGWFHQVLWFSQWDLLYHDAETDERRTLLRSPFQEA